MPSRSTPDRYGSVAITIHWLSALAVILAFGAGFTAANIAPPGQQGPVLLAHIVLGSLVLVLTLLRIVWWLVADRHPVAMAGEPGWRVTASKIVHGLLYVILLLMASSGIVTVVLSGAVPAILSGAPVPDFSELIPRMAHGIMSRLLLVLLVGHIGAALWHQFVRGDHLLARMGVGRA